MDESRVVVETLDVADDRVYEFARHIDRMPQWASGLASGVTQEHGAWFASAPMGRVRVDMVARNDLGVMDHDVTLPDGTTVHNAFRVTPAGRGSVLTFTVLRQPGTGQAAFDADIAHVQKDLKALKELLERQGAAGRSRR